MQEASGKRHQGGGIIEEASLGRHHGGGIMEEASGRRHHGGDILEVCVPLPQEALEMIILPNYDSTMF